MLRSFGNGAVSPNSTSQFEAYFDTAVVDKGFCLAFVSDEEIPETDCFCHSRACQNIQQQKCEIHVRFFRLRFFGFFDLESLICSFDFSVLIIDKKFLVFIIVKFYPNGWRRLIDFSNSEMVEECTLPSYVEKNDFFEIFEIFGTSAGFQTIPF